MWTETAVWSALFAEPVGSWIASRMPARLFGTVALLITGGAALGGAPSATWALAAAVTALLLLFQFRLWDDLADAPSDRVRHPERYLPRCASTSPFRTALGVAAASSLIAVFLLGGPAAAAGLALLNLGFAAWYRRAPEARAGVPGTMLLLLKYPAFVLLLAPAPRDPLLLTLACAAVYAAVCLHEWRTS